MVRTSRRSLLWGACAALSGAVSPAWGRAWAAPHRAPPVGATFNEQVYFDVTGQVPGWCPPAGQRGLAATAHLDETQFRMAHPYC